MVAKIKKGDRVIVTTGRDKGKKGEVLKVLPKENKAVVSGVNTAKRHTKPHQKMQNDRAPQMQQGGIVDKPMPIDVSNVMIVCPRCERVTRVKHQPLSTGKSARVCGHCNEQLEVGA